MVLTPRVCSTSGMRTALVVATIALLSAPVADAAEPRGSSNEAAQLSRKLMSPF